MSLAQKGLSGFVFTFGSNIISKGITFLGGVLLARILTPRDYGLIAMLYVIFAISNFIISGGLGLALIREKQVTEEDKTTVFYFNLLISLFLYSILWFIAPYISLYYQEPELIHLTRIMGLDLIFKSFTIVQNSMLKRELKFKLLGVIEIVSGVLTIAVAVGLAHFGFGVKSLAIKFILASLVSSILLYFFNPWVPKGFIQKTSFKKLFSFGSNVMLLGFVNTISRNFHQIIIGKYFAANSLGFFNQGRMLQDNLANTFNNAIMNVTFPMLSKIQKERDRLKSGYERIMKINCFVVFPAITLLILTAEPLVLGLLGTKWKGSIVFLQILGAVGYFRPLHSINLNVLKVMGKGKDYLIQGILRNGLTIIGVVIGANISVVAIAWALVIADFLQLFINVYYSNKYMNFTFIEQLRIMGPIVLLTLVMGTAVYSLNFFDLQSQISKLIIMCAFGSVLYLFLAKIFGSNAFNEIYGLVKHRIPKIK